jgi:hypothetical protein
MKKNILNISVIVLLINALIFSSCVKPEDLVTADAKTGGLVEAVSSNVPFKLGETTSLDISVVIPKGPAITSVEIYKTYYTVDGGVSNTILAGSISVAGRNETEDLSDGLNLTYTQLREGLTVDGNPLPTDENLLDIGNYWVFTFESILADGRTVVNNATTNVAVANFFAGTYDTEMRYFHPTAGGSHPSFPDFDPDDPYGGIRYGDKDLVAINANTCRTNFAVWGPVETMDITVNPDNSVSFTVDGWSYDVLPGNPFDASQVSNYDPATGTIMLYYHYYGSGGARIFWEEFTLPTK